MYPLFPSLFPYPTETLQAVLVGALLLLARRWPRIRAVFGPIPRSDVAWLLGLGALGLTLRLYGGVRVPGHINSHGYEYLNTLFSGPLTGMEFHGNGSYALHGIGLLVLPRNEASVIAMQLACSVLTIPACYALSRLWLRSRDAALASATIATVFPSHVFYGMTEERFVGGVLFLSSALVVVAVAARERGLATWIAAGMLGAFAASFQPFLAIFPVAAGALLLVTEPGREALRQRGPWCALAVFSLLSIETVHLALTNIAEQRGPAAMVSSGLSAPWNMFLPRAGVEHAGNALASAELTPPPFLWLALFGVAAALFGTRNRGAALVMAAITASLILPGTASERMNGARLQLPAHAFAVLVAGYGLAVVVEWLRASAPAPLRSGVTALHLLVPIASIALWPGPIGASFTPQLERRVAIEGLSSVEPGCEILISISAPGLEYLSRGDGGHRWRRVEPGSIPPVDARCRFYFRPARCFDLHDGPAAPGRSDGLRDDCAEIERQIEVSPVFVRSVASRPDYGQRYQNQTLAIGYFRVGAPGP